MLSLLPWVTGGYPLKLGRGPLLRYGTGGTTGVGLGVNVGVGNGVRVGGAQVGRGVLVGMNGMELATAVNDISELSPKLLRASKVNCGAGVNVPGITISDSRAFAIESAAGIPATAANVGIADGVDVGAQAGIMNKLTRKTTKKFLFFQTGRCIIKSYHCFVIRPTILNLAPT